MKHKFFSAISAILAVSMLLSCTAFALDVTPATSAEAIPENVAEIIATYFIRDAQSLPENNWSNETKILACVPMYNIDGSTSAYSFELSTDGKESGYIVVSAYPDISNVILEYSDIAAPVYDALDLSSTDSVVYTGLLNYYKETRAGDLISIDGEEIQKTEIPTPINDIRNSTNLPSVVSRGRYPIEDPYEWADTYYEGPFKYSGDSKNEFEKYCNFRTTDDFPGYNNHCGPTAITNLVEMIGAYNKYSSITRLSYDEIFDAVVECGLENDYFNQDDGSLWIYENDFISDSFALFNVNTTVKSKDATMSNIKTELTNHRPFYLTLKKHDLYGDHAVVGYAYTRLISETTNLYLSFVKIADGWESYGRYLDITSIDESSQAILRSITIR